MGLPAPEIPGAALAPADSGPSFPVFLGYWELPSPAGKSIVCCFRLCGLGWGVSVGWLATTELRGGLGRPRRAQQGAQQAGGMPAVGTARGEGHRRLGSGPQPVHRHSDLASFPGASQGGLAFQGGRPRFSLSFKTGPLEA